MDLVITHIVEDQFSLEKETMWLKCKTDSNLLVVFWGEPGAANQNLGLLRSQQLPVKIRILDPEFCIPTAWEKSKYKISFSIPSDVSVTIDTVR